MCIRDRYTDMQLLLQKESDTAAYYEMLLSQHESQRILIHDMKKHLQSIEILNSAKEHEKIDAYIHTLLQSSDLTESARVCDHHMLNVILSRYQRQCQEKNITFHTDIRSGVPVSYTHLDVYKRQGQKAGIPKPHRHLLSGRR